jgi:hypothetical protein
MALLKFVESVLLGVVAQTRHSICPSTSHNYSIAKPGMEPLPALTRGRAVDTTVSTIDVDSRVSKRWTLKTGCPFELWVYP